MSTVPTDHRMRRQANLPLYRQAREAAAWGVAVSLGLGAVKLVGGWLGHSLGLVSDALHSLVDAAISSALFAALWIAQRPADREHPYGHARFEAVAGAGVALVLLGLGLGIAVEAVHGLNATHAPPHAGTAAIAVAGILAQELLFRYARRVATRTGSAALMATAWDYRIDALGGLAVMAGILLSRWGGSGWAWADHGAAILVAGAILFVGASLLWGNIQDLMDRQANPAVVAKIRADSLAVAGVRDVETLRVRKVGLEYLVDIHVEVDPNATVRVGHAIAHAVKDHVMDQMESVRDVLVHVEPSRSTPQRDPAGRV